MTVPETDKEASKMEDVATGENFQGHSAPRKLVCDSYGPADTMVIDRTPDRAWLSKKGAILWNRGAPELQRFDLLLLRTWRESDMCAVPFKVKGAVREILLSALPRRVEQSKLLGDEVLAGKWTTTVIKNRFNRVLATTRGLESTVASSGSGDVTNHNQNLLDELQAVAKDIDEFAQLYRQPRKFALRNREKTMSESLTQLSQLLPGHARSSAKNLPRHRGHYSLHHCRLYQRRLPLAMSKTRL
jgi:hypothetical protein